MNAIKIMNNLIRNQHNPSKPHEKEQNKSKKKSEYLGRLNFLFNFASSHYLDIKYKKQAHENYNQNFAFRCHCNIGLLMFYECSDSYPI